MIDWECEMGNSFLDLVELLKGHRVFIQTHDFPDPDAIATAYGLQELLKWKGISSEICYFGSIDKINTKLLVEEYHMDIYKPTEIDRLSEEDYVITVDGQKDNSNFTDMTGAEVACIDHHPWSTQYTYQFVKHTICGACSSIITDWIIEAGMPVDRKLATILLYGLKMDTQSFSTGVTALDIKAFGFLNELADKAMLSFFENSELELSDLRAYGAAIENVTVYEDMGFSYIPFECPDGLIAAVAEFLLAISSVSIAVVYANRNGGLKFSARSVSPELNVGRLIHKSLSGIGNGGGHATMAGGIVFRESIELLGKGREIEYSIRDRFLKFEKIIKDEMRLANV